MRMGPSGLALACVLAALAGPAGAASFAEAPAKAAPGAVVPAVSLSAPLNPAPVSGGLTGWLKDAALSAVGTALGMPTSPIQAPSLNFARRPDLLPPAPALPSSAVSGQVSASAGSLATAAAEALQNAPAQGRLSPSPSPAQASSVGSPASVESSLPGVPGGMIPLAPRRGASSRGLNQQALTIAAKTEVLQTPLETASSLQTRSGGGARAEQAKRLGDGIWSVMMDEAQTSGSGADEKVGARKTSGSPSLTGAGEASGEAPLPDPRDRAEAAESVYTAGARGGSGAAASAAAGGSAAAPAAASPFFSEALDAALAANPTPEARAAAAAPSDLRDAVAAPVSAAPPALLEVWSKALQLFGFERASAADLSRGVWRAEAGPSRPYIVAAAARAPQGPRERALSVLFAQDAAAPVPEPSAALGVSVRRYAPERPIEAPKPEPLFPSLGDALAYLSLLPLLAFALLYAREYR